MDNLKILDITITPLNQIMDERGGVYRFLRKDSENLITFGEVYFSKVNVNKVKGWKCNKIATQNFCVPHGSIKFVFYDARINSPNHKLIQEVVLDSKFNYCLITVPPGIWYSFACLSDDYSLLANVSSELHDPNNSENLPLINDKIPYKWQM